MIKNKEFIEIDGSQGEGGGQILRTSLSLSMITGKPLLMRNIRAGRKKPGMLRQHLTAVLASAQISDAKVEGAELGAKEITFQPNTIRQGNYQFSIGTAGSTTLVLQTILPALLYADGASSILLEGGTHNPLAPPVDFLQIAWLPILRRMGVHIELKLTRYGFMPSGGGCLKVDVAPSLLQPINLVTRGKIKHKHAKAIIAAIPRSVAEREIARVQAKMNWPQENCQIVHVNSNYGPGNALILEIEAEQLTEVFCSFGEPKTSAEKVADSAIGQAQRWLTSSAAVGEYLADQLLLPMALAGRGSFTCTTLSDHLTSNAEVIKRFLPVSISYHEVTDQCIQVTIDSYDSFH